MFIIIVLLHNKGLCFITVNWAKQLIILKNQVETQGHGHKGLHCFCCALLKVFCQNLTVNKQLMHPARSKFSNSHGSD